jgi:hypothetical protein
MALACSRSGIDFAATLISRVKLVTFSEVEWNTAPVEGKSIGRNRTGLRVSRA